MFNDILITIKTCIYLLIIEGVSMKAYEFNKLQIGQHQNPLEEINYLEVPLLSAMDRKYSNSIKHLKYRHFQFMGVISDELIFGCALLKAKVSSNAFIYIFLPKTNEMFKVSANDLGGFKTHLDSHPINNYESFLKKKLEIVFNQKNNEWHLKCSSKDLSAEIVFPGEAFEPMCLLTNTAGRGFTYAQKYAGIPCSGSISFKEKKYDLKALNAFAHHDWTGGFLRKETTWQWACFSGEVSDTHVGLNVSCGVNESSFTENCFWINGQLIKVNFVIFEFDRSDLTSLWHITSEDGLVNLKFTPQGYNLEKKNLLITQCNFKQIIGRFEGKIGDLVINSINGFVEDQYLKW